MTSAEVISATSAAVAALTFMVGVRKGRTAATQANLRLLEGASVRLTGHNTARNVLSPQFDIANANALRLGWRRGKGATGK